MRFPAIVEGSRCKRDVACFLACSSFFVLRSAFTTPTVAGRLETKTASRNCLDCTCRRFSQANIIMWILSALALQGMLVLLAGLVSPARSLLSPQQGRPKPEAPSPTLRRRQQSVAPPVVFNVNIFLALYYLDQNMAAEFESQLTDSPRSRAVAHFCQSVNYQVREFS
jgi:hypothetical protein